MNSLPSPPSEESMFTNLVNLSSNTLKDAFSHIGGKIVENLNQIRETVAREIIRFLKSRNE